MNFEWLLGVAVSLIAVITPIIKLNTNISKLNATLQLFQEYTEQKQGELEKRVTKHGDQIDNLEKTVAKHDIRIENIEKR